jgi:hypothetical protein
MFRKIEVWFKFFIKKIAVLFPVNLYQRPLAFSIVYNEFPSLQETKKCLVREELWNDALRLVGEAPISFVEFGVLEGYSIKYFASKNNNEKSSFIGLDSFVGLPDAWDGIPKGTLDVGGNVPVTNDSRVAFIKGWFQDTSFMLMDHLKRNTSKPLIVHFDADLYSSTLFALTEIDSLKKEYFAIFDEFAGHESRALYNYIQSHSAKVTFLGRVMFDYQPWCVLCKIEPHKPEGDVSSIVGTLQSL